MTSWPIGLPNVRWTKQFGSPPGVDNEENGAPIRACHRPTTLLVEIWPQIARIG